MDLKRVADYLVLSRCKGCGTYFEPWKHRCARCGRTLPIVGTLFILSILFAGCELANLFAWVVRHAIPR
jgi:hypothetical protein